MLIDSLYSLDWIVCFLFVCLLFVLFCFLGVGGGGHIVNDDLKFG